MSGLSFGIISGVFSVINILADSIGPGIVGIHGDSPYYFITSGEAGAGGGEQSSLFLLFWSVQPQKQSHEAQFCPREPPRDPQRLMKV